MYAYKNQIIIKSYNLLLKNKKPNGFTLIELLVVIIILGVLTATSLPNFIGQVGKAREVDAKNNLGTIARAQQAYHFEKQTFANDLDTLDIPNNFTSSYYTFPNPVTVNSTVVKHQAIATNPSLHQVRNFSTGIYHDAGKFDITLCQSKAINQVIDVGNTANAPCTNNGIKIR